MVDHDSTLIGVISTESEAATTDKRDLRAITLAHISRTLTEETGLTLDQFLSQDLPSYALAFQTNIAPSLSKLIIDAVTKK